MICFKVLGQKLTSCFGELKGSECEWLSTAVAGVVGKPGFFGRRAFWGAVCGGVSGGGGSI